MKDYFIRVFFGLLTLGIVFCLATIFHFDWFQKGSRSLFILPIVFVGGWGGWFLYKRRIKEKVKN